MLVSDGLCYPMREVGSYTWIIPTKDGKKWIEGGGLVPGEKYDQGAYRSELCVHLSGVTFLESISLQKVVYSIKIACEGLSALNQVGEHAELIECSRKHRGIISFITDIREKVII